MPGKRSNLLVLIAALLVSGAGPWAEAAPRTASAEQVGGARSGVEPADTAQVEALRRRVAELEATVAEREAELRAWQARSVASRSGARVERGGPGAEPAEARPPGRAEQGILRSVAAPVVAGATDRRGADRGEGGAPTSTLAWSQALAVATAARYLVPGAGVLVVEPTGSMRPVFDERALLLTEPAPFAALRVGDIVTYRHPAHGLPVVHRLAEKRGNRFWAKGDGNARMDDVYITPENYGARVFGIVYASEAGAGAPRAAGGR